MTRKREKRLNITQDMIDEMEEVVIPELEEAKKLIRNIEWTEHDVTVLRKYYGKVPTQSLVEYYQKLYPPNGRTRSSIEHEACQLNLTRKKKRAS